MCWLCSFYIFPAIDANNSEKEKKWFGQEFYLYWRDSYFDEVEEVQRQISQGKPSLDLWILNHILWLLCYYYCLSIYLVWFLLLLSEHAYREHVYSLWHLADKPLFVNGGCQHHDHGVPSKCDGYAHLPWVCRPLDTLFAPLSDMMVSIMPLLYLLPCDAMHTYSQVCRTSCWCYTYLLPSMLNPLLLLCMLTLSMYAPLTTYFTIFLVVWWSTSWPLLSNPPTYVVPMCAYPKHV